MIDVYEMVRHFRRDYEQLQPLALSNMEAAISLEFREASYFTHPTPGQKRLWVDALVRLVVTCDGYWTSDEIKFSQVSLVCSFKLITK